MKTKTHWHAGRILFALARHFKWSEKRMMPEFQIDGGFADLVVVSRAGYLTEIEIKVSLHDWQKDKAKGKFKAERPHVARFFYAIPESLATKVPAWVPEGVGILVIHDGTPGNDFVTQLRPAKHTQAGKVPEDILHKLLIACYYRFWRSIEAEQQRLCSQRRAA